MFVLVDSEQKTVFVVVVVVLCGLTPSQQSFSHGRTETKFNIFKERCNSKADIEK